MCWFVAEGGANGGGRGLRGGGGIKKGDKRGAQALRGAREATRAAKASKNGDKRETKERKKTTIWGAKARGRGWAKPLDYILRYLLFVFALIVYS